MNLHNRARRAVGGYCALLLLSPWTMAAQERSVTIAVDPLLPLIECRYNQQLLNFDFALHDGGNATLRLREIEVVAFDQSGAVTRKKTVNSNGLRPGIEVVSLGLLHPGETSDIFNPFFSFRSDVGLSRLQYEFRLVVENTSEQMAANRHRLPMDFHVEIPMTIQPSKYQTKSELHVPLHGRVLVWEGHDYFAHHRRVPIDSDLTRQTGIEGVNANRYASDLVIVNDRGEMFHDDPYVKTNYYTYGQPIYAPAGGVVKKAHNDVPDNSFVRGRIRYPQLPPDIDGSLGNLVLIDHGNGEFSIFPHMRLGSLRVKVGDHIRQGQILGEVGFSGDAIYPHVHYALLSGPDVHRNEGLPAYFDQVIRINGNERVLVNHATLDTGDLVESASGGVKNDACKSGRQLDADGFRLCELESPCRGISLIDRTGFD